MKLKTSCMKVFHSFRYIEQANRPHMEASLSIVGCRVIVSFWRSPKEKSLISIFFCKGRLSNSPLSFWYIIWAPRSWKLGRGSLLIMSLIIKFAILCIHPIFLRVGKGC